MEGGGPPAVERTGLICPAEMTCRNVGHGSVRACRYRIASSSCQEQSKSRLSHVVYERVEFILYMPPPKHVCIHDVPCVPSHATGARPTSSPRAGRQSDGEHCSRAGRPCLLLPAPCRHARAPQRSMSPSPRAAPGQLPRGVSYRSLPSHVPRGALHPRDPPLAGHRRLRGAHVATIRSTPTARPRYPSPRLALSVPTQRCKTR